MNTRLFLVRHGQAENSTNNYDPGLSLIGVKQAMALALAPEFSAIGETRLAASPLLRARETALPISATLEIEREIDPGYAELPWRKGQTVVERATNLPYELRGNWDELSVDRQSWREAVIHHAMQEEGTVIIVTHFMVINVLVGAALNDSRVVVCKPDNTSITEIHIVDATLHLIKGVNTVDA